MVRPLPWGMSSPDKSLISCVTIRCTILLPYWFARSYISVTSMPTVCEVDTLARTVAGTKETSLQRSQRFVNLAQAVLSLRAWHCPTTSAAAALSRRTSAV